MMNKPFYTQMMLVTAVLFIAGSLSAQDASSLAIRKKSDKTTVEVLATDKEKMEVAEAIDHVLFDFDRATINPDNYAKLLGLAAWMKGKDVTLLVSGFADAIGTDRYNAPLSETRAKAVKAYLVSKGVDPGNIDSVGFGEMNPRADNGSESGRKKNRRVEFALY